MIKKINWKIIAGIAMVVLSIIFYFLHFLIFRDLHHIFIYLLGDIAFVFLEVLLVTIIIHQLLNEWDKQSRLKKLNMVIETFFSEFGKHLLVYLSNHDKNINKIHDFIIVKNGSDNINYKTALKVVKNYKSNIDITKIDLLKLSNFLTSKRRILVNLLQNPNLLEHETFTETLMAIFHIVEELSARDLNNLSEEDVQHLNKDIERAYNLLIFQWLCYMEHIKESYPYFFVFAMKTNPFDEKTSWLERWHETIEI